MLDPAVGSADEYDVGPGEAADGHAGDGHIGYACAHGENLAVLGHEVCELDIVAGHTDADLAVSAIDVWPSETGAEVCDEFGGWDQSGAGEADERQARLRGPDQKILAVGTWTDDDFGVGRCGSNGFLDGLSGMDVDGPATVVVLPRITCRRQCGKCQ